MVDPYNPHILRAHLLAAAHELPLDRDPKGLDAALFGKLGMTETIADLVQSGELLEDNLE